MLLGQVRGLLSCMFGDIATRRLMGSPLDILLVECVDSEDVVAWLDACRVADLAAWVNTFPRDERGALRAARAAAKAQQKGTLAKRLQALGRDANRALEDSRDVPCEQKSTEPGGAGTRRLLAIPERSVLDVRTHPLVASAIDWDPAHATERFRLGEHDWQAGDTPGALAAWVDAPDDSAQLSLRGRSGWLLTLDQARLCFDHDSDDLAERVLCALRPRWALEEPAENEADLQGLAQRFGALVSQGYGEVRRAARMWWRPSGRVSPSELFRCGAKVIAEPWNGWRLDVEDPSAFESWLCERAQWNQTT